MRAYVFIFSALFHCSNFCDLSQHGEDKQVSKRRHIPSCFDIFFQYFAQSWKLRRNPKTVYGYEYRAYCRGDDVHEDHKITYKIPTTKKKSLIQIRMTLDHTKGKYEDES